MQHSGLQVAACLRRHLREFGRQPEGEGCASLVIWI